MSFNNEGAMSGAATGASIGTVIMPGVGTAIGAGVGLVAGGFMPKSKGPDYGYLDQLYSERKAQIGQFGQNLASARARYLTSLNNMYSSAYARFSGNAEAGFASRGLAVNGGAFASALAKQSAQYQSELEPLAFQAEREDLRSVDSAYAGAAGMYAGGRSGGAVAGFNADREDMRSIGGFAGKLGMLYAGNRMASSPVSNAGANVEGSTMNSRMGPSWNGWNN